MGRRKKDILKLSDEERALFSRIYEQYRGLLLSTAARVVQDPDECEELIQESCIRLMQNISVISQLECCELVSYIVLTIRRTQIDRYRAQSRDACVESLDDEAVQASLQEQLTLEQVPLDSDAKLDVMQLMDSISARDRELLSYWYLKGSSVEELAEKLNCKPSSLRAAMCRLRKRAIKILTGKDGGSDG